MAAGLQWESRKERADRTGQTWRECGGDGGHTIKNIMSDQGETSGRVRRSQEDSETPETMCNS